MRLSLRVKLFLFVPIIALVPWLGYQTLVKLEQFATQAQTESLRVLADSLRPELNRVVAPARQQGLTLVPQPLDRAPSIDGVFDEWLDIPQLQDDTFSVMTSQFDKMVYFAVEVTDNTRFYQEPLFGRTNPVPFDFLRFSGGKSKWFSIQFAPEASGRFEADVIRESNPQNQNLIIDAYWWETATGYRLEWGIPVFLIDSVILELMHHDHNWIEPISRTYNLTVEPLRGDLQRFARQLAGESRQILIVDRSQRVIAKTPPLDDIPDLLLSDIDQTEGLITQQNIRLSIPVQTDKGSEFYVVISAPRSELVGRSQQALVTLAWQTLGVILILVIGLSMYSGRLAQRIKGLGADLKSHLDDRGRINENAELSDANANDEVGDLSRDVGIMLNDLKRYTLFLEIIPRTLKHELSNPMSAIQTSLELLADEDDPEQQLRLRAIAIRGIQKLESTLAKVTEAASLEEALRDEVAFTFNASKIVRDSIDAMRRSNPLLIWNLDLPDNQLVFIGNDFRFEQLLDKLLDNAVEFTHDNGRISVRLIDGITTATLIVENIGPSIDERVAQTAFQMFSGTRNDSTGSHLGLGLYVVRLIAESMLARPIIKNTEYGVQVLVSGFRIR